MRPEGAGPEIEFLAPDSRAFADADTVDFVGVDGDDAVFDDEAPRPRWLAALAAVVVTGLIGAGVLAAAPWAGPEAAPDPTSTTTTVPPTTAPDVAADVMGGVSVTPTGWLVDRPAPGMEFAGSWSFGPGGGPTEPLDIWVERSDRPSEGRWVVVSRELFGDGEPLVEDGSRLAAGGLGMLLWTDPSGVIHVRARPADPEAAATAIRSRGVDPTALVDLATRVVDDGARTSGIGYEGATPTALAGLTLAWSGRAQYDGVGALRETRAATRLYAPATGSGMEIQRRTVERTLLPFVPLLLRPVPLDPSVEAEMRALGRPTEVFSFGPSDDEPWLLAISSDGDDDDGAIAIRAYDVELDAVLATMAALRPAAAAEWADRVEETQRGIRFDEAGPSPSARLQGALADGSTWEGRISETWSWVQTRAGGWGTPLRVRDGATVRRYASIGADVVIATATPTSTAVTMRVTAGAAPPVDMSLVQIGTTSTVAAMFVQTGIGPITVELLDATGDVVAG